jgi:hypothetical protein
MKGNFGTLWPKGKNAKSPDQLPGISEAEFQRQVVTLAHRHGWRVAHFRSVRCQRPNGQVFYQTPVQADGRGFPDLILLRQGRQLAVELKVGKNDATAEQLAWLQAFRLAGAKTHIWRPSDWAFIEEVLRG